MKRSWIFMRPPLVDSSSELGKGLFDLMEKFLKFRINGWPVYKASSLLVHCPLISGEECWCPKTTGDHQTQNTKPKFFSQPNSNQVKLNKINSSPPNTTPKFFFSRLLNITLHCSMQEWLFKEMLILELCSF